MRLKKLIAIRQSGQKRKAETELARADARAHVALQPLPLGTQSFEILREEKSVYADKTHLLFRLITEGRKGYFLARPRRFGKTLVVSTLESIFKGRADLFDGLAIARTDYAFEKFPVIRLDMSQVSHENLQDFKNTLNKRLKAIADQYKKPLDLIQSPKEVFQDLIEAISEQSNTVVILIDEYDAPIIGQMFKDAELAEEIGRVLNDFYRVIKSMSEQIRFVFVTGITNTEAGSVFSGINHLTNLTTHSQYSTLCGITQSELESCFADRLPLFADELGLSSEETLEAIKYWYNGYRFARSSTAPLVYNPYSTLLMFDFKEFQNFWFRTGTPTLLVECMQRSGAKRATTLLKSLNRRDIHLQNLELFKAETFSLAQMLYQTGYLTIRASETDRRTMRTTYHLDWPNEEVRQSLLEVLLGEYSKTGPEQTNHYQLIELLKGRNVYGFVKRMYYYFTTIPYDLNPYAQIPHREQYFQTIFHTILNLLGFDLKVTPETRTNIGRIDLRLELEDTVYIIELKMNKDAETAFGQILEKKYYEQDLLAGKKVILVGINFNTETRNIDEYTYQGLNFSSDSEFAETRRLFKFEGSELKICDTDGEEIEARALTPV